MSSVVLDDHLLLDCLRDREPLAVSEERGRGRLFTTGLWYHRLCRALAVPGVEGTLSRPLRNLAPTEARRLTAAVTVLSPAIRLVSLRDLAWPMAEILRVERLNLIALEALAVARQLGAPLCVWEGNDGPRLRSAADRFGVRVVAVAN